MIWDTCDCVNEMWLWSHCPFYLECLDAADYTVYCRLIRDDTGKVTGYMVVMEKI